MIETITGKWFIVAVIGVLAAAAYILFSRKDKNLEALENEYNEILTGEEYKVKGQY